VIFADRYDIVEFHDSIMVDLLFFDPITNPDEIRRVFENTSVENPIRLYMVEDATSTAGGSRMEMSDLLDLDGTGFLPLFLEWRDEGKHRYTDAKMYSLEHSLARHERFMRGTRAHEISRLLSLFPDAYSFLDV
jgi:hypothetical protein